jgi:hypothetical protein
VKKVVPADVRLFADRVGDNFVVSSWEMCEWDIDSNGRVCQVLFNAVCNA